MKQLPDKIKLAMARYFANRRRAELSVLAQHPALEVIRKLTSDIPGVSVTYGFPAPSVVQWDKDADRDAIGEAADKHGLSYSSAGGTHFFAKRTRSGKSRIVFQCNEHNYLDSGERTVNRVELQPTA